MGFPIENEIRGIPETEEAPSQAGPEASGTDRLPDLARWIAVAGGLGYVPFAPGTAGSFAAALGFLVVGCAVWLPGLASGPAPEWNATLVSEMPGEMTGGLGAEMLAPTFALVIGAVMWLGIWAAGRAEQEFGKHDDGRIVIDEVVGQWIALFPLVFLFEPGRDGFFALSTGVVTGFVLFRVFDVWKPGAVRWAERRFAGGLGVMADDVVAGGYGAAGLVVAELLFSQTRFLDTAQTMLGTMLGKMLGTKLVVWLNLDPIVSPNLAGVAT